jgi:hypothetical protein
MLLYVVERGEVSSEEVIDKNTTMSSCRVDQNELRGMGEIAFVTDCEVRSVKSLC